MESYEDLSEDELTSYIIQMSLEESYQDALKYDVRLKNASDENVRVVTAIEKGDVCVLKEMLRHSFAFRELDSRGWLPLHRAASQPILAVLETMFFSDFTWADAGREDNIGGETALTLAAKAGLVENVKTLLEHGASPHNTNSNNESPLLLAVRARSYEMAYMLIARGAWVEQVCRKKWTAMHEAAKVGSSEIMLLLIRHGGHTNQKDIHGVTPLSVAAECGHLHILDILLQHGSKVNAQALNGESILTDAAGSGNPDCVKLLLQNGADPNLASGSGHLPIHKAAFQGHYDVLNILIPLTTKKALKYSGQSPVHSAADGGQSKCLELLIAHDYDINSRMNTRNSENYTDLRKSALYFAVSNGDVASTEVLLNAGAKPNLDPLNCLLVAVRAGWYQIVKLLLDKQANVNCYFRVVSDTVFPTALQYCLKDEMMMRLLLNNGYDAEACFRCNHDNLSGCTAEPDMERIPFCEFMSLCCLMHLAGRVVRILLDYVSHVSICLKLRLILEKQPEWPEICDIHGNPRPLKHLCRLQIRRLMTLKRLNDTRIMESFPPGLRNFLLYKELDLYGHTAEFMM